jgi:hypothetical protein
MLPGGLGGTELTMIALLGLAGIDGGTAVAATAVIRITTLWFACILGFLALPFALFPRPGLVSHRGAARRSSRTNGRDAEWESSWIRPSRALFGEEIHPPTPTKGHGHSNKWILRQSELLGIESAGRQFHPNSQKLLT